MLYGSLYLTNFVEIVRIDYVVNVKNFDILLQILNHTYSETFKALFGRISQYKIVILPLLLHLSLLSVVLDSLGTGIL